MPLLSGARRPLLVLLSALLIGLGLVAPAQAATAGTSVSVTVQTPESLVIDVTGAGFSTQPAGVYVGLAERGITATAVDLVGTAYVPHSAMTEAGGFTQVLSLDAEAIATLDPESTYAVHTVKAHNMPDPGNTQSTATDVALDFAALGLAEAAKPSVEVSQTEVSAEGATTVTVTGSGFDPSVVTGTRPPFAGTSGGVYVVFGKFAEEWSPAAGAPASARKVVTQKWAVPADQAAGGDYVALDADGSFSAELVVDKSAADAVATAADLVNYGIYTYPGSGAKNADFETFTPLTFVAEAAKPSVEVSQTEVSAEGATTVTVTGSGFDPSVVTGTRPPFAGTSGGVYVVFGKFAEEWSPAAGAPAGNRVNSDQRWAVPADQVALLGDQGIELRPDGSFTAQLTVSKFDIDAKATAESLVNYGIYTYPGGGAKNADFETYTPLTFTDEAPAKPSVEVSQTEVSPTGATTVTVTGSGFDPSAVSASRPPLAGSSAGVYVVFGKFAEQWRPSEGAASSTRVNSSQKWAVLAKDMAAIGGDAAGAIELRADGSFTAELTIDKDAIDAKATAESLVNYGIYTYPGGGAKNADFETATPLTFSAPEPETAALTWGVKESFRTYVSGQGSITLGDGLTAGAAGYTWPFASSVERGNDYSGSVNFSAHGGDLDITIAEPRVRASSAKAGVLSVLVDRDGESKRVDIASVDLTNGVALPFAGTVSFVAAPVTLLASGVPVFGEFYEAGDALDPATFSIAASALDFGDQPEPTPTPTTPKPTPTPTADAPKPEKKGAGYLQWGVKQSFRDYISKLADGSIVLRGGASTSGSTYRFGQASTNANDSGIGTTSYRGSVTFKGHLKTNTPLDVTVSNPAVKVTSGSSADLIVSAGGKRVTMAKLDLSRASVSRSNGAIVYKGTPTRITAAGKSIFGSNGRDYTTMDPVTFAIGSDSAGGGGTIVAATADSDAGWTPPAEPPATTGAQIEDAPEDGFAPGDVIAASASGFAPNEVGVRAVVYSDPIVLATDLTADAAGQVEWKGTLPSMLEPGEHTLTFQGSVSRGITFTVAEEELEGFCAVSDASMEWGFKESFRSYISSSIAKGEWTTQEPATYETPLFTFPGDGGQVASDLSGGDVEFSGGITFTGHENELVTGISDPRITFLDEDSAVMVLDFASTDREQAEAGSDLELVETEDVEFLRLDLSKAEIVRDGQQVTMTGIPAGLTAQGDAAFPTYSEGDEFDPIDLTFTVASDCAASSTGEDTAQTTTEVTAEGDDSGSNALWWGLGGLGALALLGAGIWIGRRGAAA